MLRKMSWINVGGLLGFFGFCFVGLECVDELFWLLWVEFVSVVFKGVKLILKSLFEFCLIFLFDVMILMMLLDILECLIIFCVFVISFVS